MWKKMLAVLDAVSQSEIATPDIDLHRSRLELYADILYQIADNGPLSELDREALNDLRTEMKITEDEHNALIASLPVDDQAVLSTILAPIVNDNETRDETTLQHNRVLQYLSLTSPFACLDPDDLIALSHHTTEEVYGPWQPLLWQGDNGQDLFVLIEGTAAVIVERKNSQCIINRLEAGDMVGEMSLYTSAPRSATVIPTSHQLHVLRIEGDFIRSLLKNYPDIAQRVESLISRRLRQRVLEMVASA